MARHGMAWRLLRMESDLDLDFSGNIIQENYGICVFAMWFQCYLRKVGSESINHDNLKMKKASLVETCGRFPRPGFWMSGLDKL